MIVERINVPTALPFDLDAIKDHARMGPAESDFDALLTRTARGVALDLESAAQVALLRQTIRLIFYEWPEHRTLALPIGPVPADAAVTLEADGAAVVGAVLHPGRRPRLRLPVRHRCADMVAITYEAGLGFTAADVPADLALALADQTLANFDGAETDRRRPMNWTPAAARVIARYRGVWT